MLFHKLKAAALSLLLLAAVATGAGYHSLTARSAIAGRARLVRATAAGPSTVAGEARRPRCAIRPRAG